MGLFGKRDKLQIITFQGYGTDTHFYARGRALEDEEIDLSQKGVFNLIWNTYKRFETDEVKNTEVTISLPNGERIQGVTNKSGYYKIKSDLQELRTLTNSEGWLHFGISFNDTNLKREIVHQNRFAGEMLIPSSKARFGVISDIDDTILHTGVVSSLKWKVIFNTVFKTAERRKPLAGAAEFYQLLHQGKSGDEANPIFYVSHSPWNMYRYLELFLKRNLFPKGPILLRSFPIFGRKKPNEKPQKQKEILNILKTYPDLPIILIGDSGEYDADIYKEITELYPEQIKAIYLRSVAHKKRMKRVKSLFSNYRTVPVLLVESSEQAIAHAKTHEFIK